MLPSTGLDLGGSTGSAKFSLEPAIASMTECGPYASRDAHELRAPHFLRFDSTGLAFAAPEIRVAPFYQPKAKRLYQEEHRDAGKRCDDHPRKNDHSESEPWGPPFCTPAC
jgi:hypothetical protein